MVEFYPSGEGRPAMGSLKQTLWWVRSSVCVCVCLCVCVPEAHSMQMVGPWGRYLPQWLRAPCKGSGPARSTQHADGRTLG